MSSLFGKKSDAIDLPYQKAGFLLKLPFRKQAGKINKQLKNQKHIKTELQYIYIPTIK